MGVVIKASGLAKSYDGTPVFAAVDLAVSTGELCLLTGPNGSGKTTMLRCLAGVADFQGSLALFGETITAAHDNVGVRQRTAYLGDEPALFDDLDVWTHGHVVATVWGVKAWGGPYEELLTAFGLIESQSKTPNQLSRGMRQKLAICMALLHAPELFIIDEPFVGLDTASRDTLVGYLQAAMDRGAAAIVATHEPQMLAAMATTQRSLADPDS